MLLQVSCVMGNRLVFFVGVVFRIKAPHFFGDAAVSVTVKVNGNEGDAAAAKVLAFREDGGFGLGLFGR